MRYPKSVEFVVDGETHKLVPIENDPNFICIPEKCSMYNWCYEGHDNAYKRFCEKFFKRAKYTKYHFILK
ncbi:MAG: hypothetical protein ACTTJK_04410 [Phocaeicola sp.]|uniref:hypothetical protein n=1 Tax=Phocaeicola sp. TaxID=2773926 RepID=UPI003F9EF927